MKAGGQLNGCRRFLAEHHFLDFLKQGADVEAAGSVKAGNNGRELHTPGAEVGSGASPTTATDNSPVANGWQRQRSRDKPGQQRSE